ncbi:hypothetical protein AKJ09_05476 [Labilithrix luteola]|uniref:DUF202 domain-containing protein n=1 Tax=Labilithrix luteola TaxID=1391654 RepID=A0A0K1PZ95_9BACT|nr:DUF202 domain-containing protein [Labilithrix luteola]AKU98812.1 hypothetical protein AKJ09_05476 [Labilithrix luteola]
MQENSDKSAAPHLQGSLELASRNTGLAFQRTRLAAERTFMAMIRTALSLIGFGFTIFQFFRALEKSSLAEGSVRLAPARNFSVTLIVFGLVVLVLGMWNHFAIMRALKAERRELVAAGLLHGELPFQLSIPLLSGCALLVIGLVAVFALTMHQGPFH